MYFLILALASFAAGMRHDDKHDGGDDDFKEFKHDPKTHGLYMALTEPQVPLNVRIPLSEEQELKFAASRDAVLHSVGRKAAMHDTTHSATKEHLRARHKSNQERTLEILISAVRAGMTVQEARIGSVLAQFELLPEDLKQRALAAARLRQERTPQAQRDAIRRQLQERNEKERERLEALGGEPEREEYVRSVWQPTSAHPAALQ
eukprot:CAMPEP_0172184244 /NCGR_PEP_ID=MMETSP1050-20130122/19460_1 /TAXON_ID=233186 /ORGANISM="Cryptomonas curvata, Strain CCAP979/52" /LENGTH=204 /DNA_ID=CAMNT_0012858005 /DNA_START=34 /DNA_END=648 /DNA_ORIENTATION=+